MSRRKKYTKEYLEPLVKQATGVADLIRLCGCIPSGGMHRLLKGYLEDYGFDTSHFMGQGWLKGITTHTIISDDDVFSNERLVQRSVVRRRFRLRTKYQCQICQDDPVWRGKPLALHMDHINGDHTDNRFENLRWLCPNCHQQTLTWGKGNA
jgi:hypothetical protein